MLKYALDVSGKSLFGVVGGRPNREVDTNYDLMAAQTLWPLDLLSVLPLARPSQPIAGMIVNVTPRAQVFLKKDANLLLIMTI